MSPDTSSTFDLCGGYLAIDFANTVDARHGPAPVERLTGYEALVAFCEQSGVLQPERAGELRSWAAVNPAAAQAITRQAITLRETLHGLFAAVAARNPPAPADLNALNRWWRSLRLGPDWTWQWAEGDEAPDQMLGRILISAVDLLTSPRRERVRTCGADTCLWLFLDTSKNGSRRWCDMNQCGNRIKARRFYRRQRDTNNTP